MAAPTAAETVTGSGIGTGINTVATSSQLSGAAGLFIAEIGLRRDDSNQPTVQSIDGGGLTWTRLETESGGDDGPDPAGELRTDVWTAEGTPDGGSAFTVTVTLTEDALARTVRVTRWTGYDTTTPIDGVVTARTDNTSLDPAEVTQSTTVNDSVAVVAIALRNRTITSEPNYTEGTPVVASTGSDTVNLYSATRAMPTAGSSDFEADLSTTSKWVIVAYAVRPAAGENPSGTGTLSGGGALASSGTKIGIGSGAGSGGGALASSGIKIGIGTGSLSGSGSLSASGSEGLGWVVEVNDGDGYDDWTAYVDPWPAASIENRATAESGSAVIGFVDPPATPLNDWLLRVTFEGAEQFEGIIRGVKHRDEVTTDGPRVEIVTAIDFTTLLDDDVVPRVWRSAAETDKERITWLIETYGTHGITAGDEVQSIIGSMPEGSDGRPEQEFGPSSLRAAIAKVTALTGGKVYVDFDKQLHHFETEATAAPFALSDEPNDSTSFGYWAFELDDDDVPRVDEVVVFGANDLQVTRTVADPPDDAVKRITYLVDENVTTTAEANAVGDAFLAANAGRRSGSLKTAKHGLRAGMTVQVTHQGYGLTDEAFYIHSVTIRPDGPDTAVYEVALGDEAASLESIIGGPSGALTVAQKALNKSVDTAVTVADLSVAGANLVENSSFESASTDFWTVGAGWTFGHDPTPAEAFDRSKVARLVRAGTAAGALITDQIAVDRTDDYWVSYWSFLRSLASGTIKAEVIQYDSEGDPIASSEIAIGAPSAAESAWTRYTLRLGPNDQLGRFAFHDDCASIAVSFDDATTGTFTWDVDGVQVERGKLLTAYAPTPAELADGAIDTVHIADDAITAPKVAANAIVAGKIAVDAVTAATIEAGAVTTNKLAADAVIANVLNAGGTVRIDEDGIEIADELGNSQLTSGGFHGSWADLLADGLYNSRFSVGTLGALVVSETSGGDTDADYAASLSALLPYWVVKSIDAGGALALVTSAGAPSGRAVRFTRSSGSPTARIYQDIPLPGLGVAIAGIASHSAASGYGLRIAPVPFGAQSEAYLRVEIVFAFSGSNYSISVEYSWRNETHGLISGLATAGTLLTGGVGTAHLGVVALNSRLFVGQLLGNDVTMDVGSAVGGQVDVTGNLSVSGNIEMGGDFTFMAVGVVAITPVANTPTSETVTGLGLDSGTYHGFTNADTVVPGTGVTETSATSVTNGGAIIWITRTNTTQTNVEYLIVKAM